MSTTQTPQYAFTNDFGLYTYTGRKIGIYVRGMTVYDDVHVGHARAMVVFDAFVRYLRFGGWDVNFVRNFTDVDDKIIRRGNELGEEEPLALARLCRPLSSRC